MRRNENIKNQMAITAYSFLQTRRMVERSYKKAITSYIQTSQCSDQRKPVVKIIAAEARNCTVGDCIRIMMIDSQEEQAWAIANEQKNLQYRKEMLEGCRAYMKIDTDCIQMEYEQQIHQSQRRINLLRNTHPERMIQYYEDWNQEEILAVYVVCSYEIYLPQKDSSQLLTETFIIAPDGETVIGKEPHGKLSPARRKVKVVV